MRTSHTTSLHQAFKLLFTHPLLFLPAIIMYVLNIPSFWLQQSALASQQQVVPYLIYVGVVLVISLCLWCWYLYLASLATRKKKLKLVPSLKKSVYFLGRFLLIDAVGITTTVVLSFLLVAFLFLMNSIEGLSSAIQFTLIVLLSVLFLIVFFFVLTAILVSLVILFSKDVSARLSIRRGVLRIRKNREHALHVIIISYSLLILSSIPYFLFSTTIGYQQLAQGLAASFPLFLLSGILTTPITVVFLGITIYLFFAYNN